MKTRKSGAIRIGGGSGFLNDRVDAALELVERGNIDVLMMETLAERTLALLHVARRKGGPGYWDNLGGRLDVLLPALAQASNEIRHQCGRRRAGRMRAHGCAARARARHQTQGRRSDRRRCHRPGARLRPGARRNARAGLEARHRHHLHQCVSRARTRSPQPTRPAPT